MLSVEPTLVMRNVFPAHLRFRRLTVTPPVPVHLPLTIVTELLGLAATTAPQESLLALLQLADARRELIKATAFLTQRVFASAQ